MRVLLFIVASLIACVVASSTEPPSARVTSTDLPSAPPSLGPRPTRCQWPTTKCAGELTKDDKGCPTCLKVRDVAEVCDRSQCPKVMECEARQFPTFDKCCPSCRPMAPPTCTMEQAKTCREGYATLKECDAMTRPAFDRATCCSDCKRPAVVDDEKKCTKEQFKACLATVDACGDDEKPLLQKGQCCMTCKRPEALLKLQDVAECVAAMPQCDTDQRPLHSMGSPCASCKPRKPVCAPACGDKQVCVGRKATKETKCVGRRVRKYRIKSKIAANKLRGRSEEQIREIVVELVQRFCSKPKNMDRCEKFKQRVLDGLQVTTKNDSTDDLTTEVTIEVPEAETETAARHFIVQQAATADSPASLVNDALNDQDDFNVEAADGGNGGPDNTSVGTSDASTVAAPLGLALAVVVAAML